MNRFIFRLQVFLLSITLILPAYAGENWYLSATINGMLGNYSGTDLRNDLSSNSIILNADYLDNYSIAVAYNDYSISLENPTSGEFNINQNDFATQLQYHYYSDALKGTITTQIVTHSISNNDATGLTDDVSVIAPKIAYSSLNKQYYIDLEYVDSSYPNNGNLSIKQYTPSFGFAFNQRSDWLQFKIYFIKTSDENLSQGEDSLISLDIKWMHWLSPDAILGVNHLFIDALIGERIFAVDNDAFSVYNLADVQQGSLLLGAGWRIGDSIDVLAIAGIEKYENKSINNTYNQQYLYLSLTKHW